jgi:hypothetical protein
VLAEPYMAFVQVLRMDPNWNVVYEDRRSVVMVRKPYPPPVSESVKLSLNGE